MEQKPSAKIKCDLCHHEFILTRDCVVTELITLHKEGLEPHEVQLTYLHCPRCGKRYPVIMDDETTLPTLEKLRGVLHKQLKLKQNGHKVNPELIRKQQKINQKLDFKRQKLAEKYNGSLYQLGENVWEQLEYRYHAW